MLILTRKKEESIIIDGKVEIQVLQIADGKVKLGIKAPKDIEILRKEVYVEIQKENMDATNIQINLGDLKKKLKNK
ncbi:carbon storage regulator CsrA [Marinisporobacter balticus]|uniref:Translational regulator CsrA n=1 Tax=Marinisporobacter balticus TaxID=2018667 RepID=A0A4R2KYN9_9FIRM|nr:carbon storage regulator CsrA [Marinisporobacter balticus]TCO76466.1 carbon storage regulator CsrA [Marinisporobacter balticus]